MTPHQDIVAALAPESQGSGGSPCQEQLDAPCPDWFRHIPHGTAHVLTKSLGDTICYFCAHTHGNMSIACVHECVSYSCPVPKGNVTCLGSSSFETDIAYGGLISQTSEWLLLFLVGPKAADGGGGDRGSYIYHLTSAPPQWHSLCEEKGGTAELAF